MIYIITLKESEEIIKREKKEERKKRRGKEDRFLNSKRTDERLLKDLQKPEQILRKNCIG